MNDKEKTIKMKNRIEPILNEAGFQFTRIYRSDALFNIVIGGDGTFLRAVRDSNFSKIPFVGINTGHLGFFQEIDIENYKVYLQKLIDGDYSVDSLKLLEGKIETTSWTYRVKAVNEFFISSNDARLLQMRLYFDDIELIYQAGDGFIVSTPAGSTAYNLSAGGAILYQTLDGYQINTVSPIKSKRYNSLPSAIVIPSYSKLKFVVDEEDYERIQINADGVTHKYLGVKSIEFSVPDQYLHRVSFTKDWYWHNLKDKFLED